jgi:hypothetical protein
MLRPIPTWVDGNWTRSRLEARWLLYLRECGIAYQYEMQGYRLPDGTAYLPDIYVPGRDVYLEIKPGEPDEMEKSKAAGLSAASGKRCLLVCGRPWPGEYFVLSYEGGHIVETFSGLSVALHLVLPDSVLEHAYEVANKTRFEHGEQERRVPPTQELAGFYWWVFLVISFLLGLLAGLAQETKHPGLSVVFLVIFVGFVLILWRLMR